ncbi:hypothetical protein [Zavarzinella formosa]|uniref:hypothetical protein n=1 Tax=Zavarzinella formosa TaxID=360055 RepID=UPI0002D42730|nr:hypothetical protein [Zavarzinella formosa]
MRIAQRADWKTISLPDECRAVTLDRAYTADEFTRIKAGRVPEVMEHKWFVFCEEPWLYFHRSLTGAGLYKVRFASVTSEVEVAEAWANSGYSHLSPLKLGDPRQAVFDSLELAALLDRQAGRPTKELWRQYFDALALARPKTYSGRLRVDEALYRWKAKELSPGLRIAVQAVEEAGAVLILLTKKDIAPRSVSLSQIAAAIREARLTGWEPLQPGPQFKRMVSF